MIYPLCRPIVTSPYGIRVNPNESGYTQFHDGIDFIDSCNNIEVMSIDKGTVCYDFDNYNNIVDNLFWFSKSDRRKELKEIKLKLLEEKVLFLENNPDYVF